MKRRIMLVCALLWLSIPQLISSIELAKETFKAANGEEYSIEHPPGWTYEVQAPAGSPISTLKLLNTTETTLFLISVIPAKAGAEIESMEALEKILIQGTKPMVTESVEKKILTQSFHSDCSYGVYCTLTDARWVSSAPPKGEYKASVTFILNCKGRIVTATLLTNEKLSDTTDLAVLILKTFRKT